MWTGHNTVKKYSFNQSHTPYSDSVIVAGVIVWSYPDLADSFGFDFQALPRD